MADEHVPAPAPGLELVIVAAILAIGGMVLTTTGVIGQIGVLVAPGATLTLIGGGWLGNVLARRGVRVFPDQSARPQPPEPSA